MAVVKLFGLSLYHKHPHAVHSQLLAVRLGDLIGPQGEGVKSQGVVPDMEIKYPGLRLKQGDLDINSAAPRVLGVGKDGLAHLLHRHGDKKGLLHAGPLVGAELLALLQQSGQFPGILLEHPVKDRRLVQIRDLDGFSPIHRHLPNPYNSQ